MPRSLVRVSLLAALSACGGSSRPAKPARHGTQATRVPARRGPSATTATHRSGPPRLVLVAKRRLPFAVQLPAAAVRGSHVYAAGGLDAGDASLATFVRIAPGRARTVL